MRAINGETLYERACDLEAQALAYVGKIANDESKIEEWRIWSAILAERTAFKHDIFDAPTIEPEQKLGHWIDDHCSECGYGVLPWNNTPFCPRCGAKMEEGE